jgi:hypothetical protein
MRQGFSRMTASPLAMPINPIDDGVALADLATTRLYIATTRMSAKHHHQLRDTAPSSCRCKMRGLHAHCSTTQLRTQHPSPLQSSHGMHRLQFAALISIDFGCALCRPAIDRRPTRSHVTVGLINNSSTYKELSLYPYMERKSCVVNSCVDPCSGSQTMS